LKDFYRLMARPAIVITTISPRGIPNAAPFSFNSPMASKPTPLYGFCCGGGARHVEEHTAQR